MLCSERNLGKKFILDNLQSRFKTPHQFILDTDLLCALWGNILLLIPALRKGAKSFKGTSQEYFAFQHSYHRAFCFIEMDGAGKSAV